MNHIQIAQQSLDLIKNDVIGLFKMNNSKTFELVINVNRNNTLECIKISQFGAIHRNFNIPLHYGQLELFPDNKNMNQMLDTPFEFDVFIKKFNLS